MDSRDELTRLQKRVDSAKTELIELRVRKKEAFNTIRKLGVNNLRDAKLLLKELKKKRKTLITKQYTISTELKAMLDEMENR